MLAEATLPRKCSGENLIWLTGVHGLPIHLQVAQSFGSKENFPFTFSSTEGVTYAEPKRTWLAILLRAESSELSTGR